MTELEKARSNLFKEIDLNKLVEEAGEACDNHADYLQALKRKGRAAFDRKVRMDDMIFEAETFMFVLNVVMNRLPLNGHTLQQFVGTLNAMATFLSGTLDDNQKAYAEAVKRAISGSFLSVGVERIKEGHDGKSE